MTLTDFLLARIADDEALAWRLLDWETPADWPGDYVGRECLICSEVSFGGTPDAMAEAAREHDEKMHRRSRVAAECEAKRLIVELHSYPMPACSWSHDSGASHAAAAACETLTLLALPYADHPDYSPDWRP